MKFCNVCQNMMYIQVDTVESTPKLQYYCKNCNNRVEESKVDGTPVEERNFVDDSGTFKSYMTPFIRFDPTLPRVSNITCTNPVCTARDKDDNEVIYIKYDHENMKYLYFCCHCQHFWKFD